MKKNDYCMVNSNKTTMENDTMIQEIAFTI